MAEEGPPTAAGRRRIELVPRLQKQGYGEEQVARRRRWLEEKTGSRLPHVGTHAQNTEAWRGNVENPIGVVQMPLGVAGPLEVHGQHAQGTFYIPLATTEGALVRSYERGMVALTRAGGASVRVHQDENRVAPVFFFSDVEDAYAFSTRLPEHLDDLRKAAESTTRYGKLKRIECLPVGRKVIVTFYFFTGDAQGMNMIVNACQEACRFIQRHLGGGRYYIFSGYNSEKRASGSLFQGGKGKKVTAGARLPEKIVRAALHMTPQQMVDVWHHTVLGHLQANAVGYNGHYANGLTALFIACGQDVANVANSSVGITHFELTDEGDLYASVTLPSLSVATVGGGTGLGTSRECLEMMGCHGEGKALKLAELAAATLLAGELSFGAAIGSGELVDAHESYGRNRPSESPP